MHSREAASQAGFTSSRRSVLAQLSLLSSRGSGGYAGRRWIPERSPCRVHGWSRQASPMSPPHRRVASKRRNTYLTALIRKSCARVSAGRCSGPTQLAWRDIPRARSASRRALRAAARGFCESSTARSARVAALNAAVIVVMSAAISVIPMAAAAIMLMIVAS